MSLLRHHQLLMSGGGGKEVLLIGNNNIAGLRVFRADNFAQLTLPSTPEYVAVARLVSNQLAITKSNTTSDNLEIYNWPAMTPIAHGVSVTSAAPTLEISPTGSHMFVGCVLSPYYRLFDTATYSLITLPVTIPSAVNAAAWSNDGTKLAIAYGNFFVVFETTGWSVVAGPIAVGDTANCLAFSPNDSILAIGLRSGGSNERRYSTSTWTNLNPTPPVEDRLPGQGFSVAWQPSGALVTYGCNGSGQNNWVNCNPTTGAKSSFATSLGFQLVKNQLSYRHDGAYLMCKGYLVDTSTYEQSGLSTPWNQVDPSITSVYFTKNKVPLPTE